MRGDWMAPISSGVLGALRDDAPKRNHPLAKIEGVTGMGVTGLEPVTSAM